MSGSYFPEKILGQWLRTQHRSLVNDVAAALDLAAGLQEAMIPARHAGLVADLRNVLDVEAGLSAIVSPTPDARCEIDAELWWIEESTPSPGSVTVAARRGVSARVFVSYTSEDRALAEELRCQLAADGHQVFLDQDLRDSIALGEKWEQRLHQRLQWADAMVCMVTSAYLASRRCTAEVGFARSRGSLLLPAQAEPGLDDLLLPRSVTDADLAPDSVGAALVKTLRRVDDAGILGWPKDRSPFPGLRPFDVDEHRLFFGRTAEVARLAGLVRSAAERVEGAALLVVGPSGCGKSSLVRAGLVPVIADEPGWWVLPTIVPGADPVAALVRELAAAAGQVGLNWTLTQVRHRLGEVGLTEVADELLLAAPGRRWRLLVVVDQFEELLTQAASAARARFVGLLRPALTGPVQMVATLRPESLNQLLADPELATLPTCAFTLRPLHREALRTIIERPAWLAGISVNERLVTRLVEDAGSGEVLPLLALMLARLADGVSGGDPLSCQLYAQLGGMQGALISQADAALADAVAVGGRSRDEVIAGLLRLVTLDELGRPTRRRVLHRKLPDPVAAELAVFVERRLLVTDIDTDTDSVVLGVAHEAFLSAWPPLAQGISAAAAALRACSVIEPAATEWDANSRPPTRLWEGGQLAAAVADTGARVHASSTVAPDRQGSSHRLRRRYHVLVTDHVDLSTSARDFLHASIRRDRRRRRRASAILSMLLILTMVAAGSAVIQQRAAQDAQRVATARQLIAQADVARSTNLRIALKLSVAALRIHPDEETKSGLINLLTGSRYSGTLTGHTGPVNSVAFSLDGRTLATASADQTVKLWDLTDPHQTTPAATLTGHTGPVNSVAFSPDGRTLATASSDRTVRVWDVSDLHHPAELVTLSDYTGTVYTVAFNPDGRTLTTSDYSRTVRVWNVSDPRHPTEVSTLTGYTGTVNAVAFSPDGHTLATADADQTVRLWDLTDPQQPSPGNSRTGRTGSAHGMASVDTLTGHLGPVYGVAYALDGRTLATAGADRTVRLWDLSDPQMAQRLGSPLLTGNIYSVVGVAFAPDGRLLATASSDRTVTLWDLTIRTQPRRIGPPLSGQNGVVRSMGFAPNGHILATGSDDGATILWDLRSISDFRDHAAERACAITEGGLNRDEWTRYIPGLAYEETCPST